MLRSAVYPKQSARRCSIYFFNLFQFFLGGGGTLPELSYNPYKPMRSYTVQVKLTRYRQRFFYFIIWIKSVTFMIFKEARFIKSHPAFFAYKFLSRFRDFFLQYWNIYISWSKFFFGNVNISIITYSIFFCLSETRINNLTIPNTNCFSNQCLNSGI